MVSSSRKGIILADLNGTLLTPRKGQITIPRSELKQTVQVALANGWETGLCSDSPHDALKKWGLKHGIEGPIISENGSKVNGIPVRSISPSFGDVKSLVIEFARENSINLLGEIYAIEFADSPVMMAGIAFGAGRTESLSIFCFASEGSIDSTLTQTLGDKITSAFLEFSIDCSPEHGYIGVHIDSDFRLMKGKILREIGWHLYQQGKELWMIGDSKSDLTYAPALCKVAMVGNADESTKNAADLVSKESYTKGVADIIRAIINF